MDCPLFLRMGHTFFFLQVLSNFGLKPGLRKCHLWRLWIEMLWFSLFDRQLIWYGSNQKIFILDAFGLFDVCPAHVWFRAQAEIGTESIRRLCDRLFTGVLPNLSVAEFALHPVLWPSSHKDHAFILDSGVISMTRKVQTQGSARAGCYQNGEPPQSSLRVTPFQSLPALGCSPGSSAGCFFFFFFKSSVNSCYLRKSQSGRNLFGCCRTRSFEACFRNLLAMGQSGLYSGAG